MCFFDMFHEININKPSINWDSCPSGNPPKKRPKSSLVFGASLQVNGFREEVARLVDECQKDQATEWCHVSWWFCTYFCSKTGDSDGIFHPQNQEHNVFFSSWNDGLPSFDNQKCWQQANKKVSRIRRETFNGIWCLIHNIRVNKPDEKWISIMELNQQHTANIVENRDAPTGNVEFRYFNL